MVCFKKNCFRCSVNTHSHPKNVSESLIWDGGDERFNLMLIGHGKNWISTLLLKHFTVVHIKPEIVWTMGYTVEFFVVPRYCFISVEPIASPDPLTTCWWCNCQLCFWLRWSLNQDEAELSCHAFIFLAFHCHCLYPGGCGPCFTVPRCCESLECVVILLQRFTAEQQQYWALEYIRVYFKEEKWISKESVMSLLIYLFYRLFSLYCVVLGLFHF